MAARALPDFAPVPIVTAQRVIVIVPAGNVAVAVVRTICEAIGAAAVVPVAVAMVTVGVTEVLKKLVG